MLLWPFCLVPFQVKSKLIPLWIALGVVALVCAARLSHFDLFERLELLSYDIRVRQALKFTPAASDRFGFVFIDESTVQAVHQGGLGYRFGLYWPRQVYGRLLDELSQQGATAIGLDVIFAELRPDHPSVRTTSGHLVESDEWFAVYLRQATNAAIALNPDAALPDLFLTNAHWHADISTEKDRDGILRRVRAFRVYRDWHPLFKRLEADSEYGVDLRDAVVGRDRIILRRCGSDDVTIPLDEGGLFRTADFIGEEAGGTNRARPFLERRVWHMGVVLAAMELGLDLEHAEVDLERGFIALQGPGGVSRRIPVDRDGRFFVDWAILPNDPRLKRRPLQDVLMQNKLRLQGAGGMTNEWQGRVVVVGSSALMGNDLTDRGATPFSADTLLVSKHWNVANSVVLGRFVMRSSPGGEMAFIVCMGFLAALITWRLRAIDAFIIVILAAGLYVFLAALLFIQLRYWMPIVFPVLGGLFLTHICLVTWRVAFEQAARRKIAAILATIVSPKVARELLMAEKLSLGGARRQITVLFADVRGFTELTDSSQERAEEHVRSKGLSGVEAEAIIDEQARATLATVNLYLGTVADVIVEHDGTLDKFIGDCVMAFWGAPSPDPAHAASCVRAAVMAQRAVHELNRRRQESNRQIEIENRARESAGLAPKPMLPILEVGTGINSGPATVGLMGSEVQRVVRQGNYTVFGREVNLASRLESISGRGHIYISQATYELLRRDDPGLASLCVALSPVTVKGIRHAVQVYEVRWRDEPHESLPSGDATGQPAPAAD